MSKETNLYKKKAELYQSFKDLFERCEKEGRAMNADEMQMKIAYVKEMEDIQATIDTAVELANIERTMDDPVYDAKGKKTGEKAGDVSMKRESALHKWIRGNDLTPEEVALLNPTADKRFGGVAVSTNMPKLQENWAELRGTNSTVTNPTYAQDITLSSFFGATKKAFGGWFDATTEIYDNSGATMYMPYHHDVGNTGAQEAVGTDMVATTEDLATNRQQIDSYFHSSGGFKVGWDALADASYDLNTWLLQPISERLMRILATAATTGTGSTAPNGIVTSSRRMELYQKGVTPTATDMNNLLKAVDWAYHTSDKSGWMFNSNTMFRIAATVKSTLYNTEPLWNPSLAAGIPQTLYGYKYWINNDMSSVGTGTVAMLFGDFSYQVNRWVGTPTLIRLKERYAELLSDAFIYVMRFDCECKVAKATTTTSHPIGHLVSIGT